MEIIGYIIGFIGVWLLIWFWFTLSVAAINFKLRGD